MDIKCSYIYNIEHRNLEIRKTCNDFSVQVRNFLLPLSLKVLQHKERDTHFFLSGFFICTPTPNLVRHLPNASPSKRKSTLLVRCPVLNSTNFLQNSQNPPHASSVWRHSHLLALFPIWAIVTSLSDMSTPHVWISVLMLHLSNPCTEPKGSQPN